MLTHKYLLVVLVGTIVALASCRGVGTVGPRVPGEDVTHAADGLALPRDVSPDMLDASYWLERGNLDGHAPDDVIMDAGAIEAINAHNDSPVVAPDGREVVLGELRETLDGDFVRALLEGATLPKRPERYSIDGKQTDAAYWKQLQELEAIDQVPKTVTVRFGFSVTWSTLRQFPSRERVATDGDEMYDRLVNTDFRPYEPLAVVHESRDGAWLYCLVDGCGGWIEREHVALCPTRDDWEARQSPKRLLVVTGPSITLGDDPYDKELSGARLPMGTRLELASEDGADPHVNRRLGYGCYVAKVPVRGKDGLIEDRTVLVPTSDDVSIGYAAYTHANVLKLAFKMLGRVYGWGGDLHSTDCSGLVQSVYSCFGFRLPRKADAQERMKGVKRIELEGKSDQEKLELLRKLPTGSPVFFDGHAMLWLGEVDGHAYVLSSVGSFGQDEGGVDEVNTVCVNTLDSSYRADGRTWLANLRTAVTLRGVGA